MAALPGPYRVFTLLLLVWVSAPAMASGYAFHSLPDSLPDNSYADLFAERRFSMGTALNDNGRLFGYTLDKEGEFHGYSVRLADNPEMAASDHPGFVFLAAANCGGIFDCLFGTPMYGIRIRDEGAQSDLLVHDSGTATSVVPGSLPFINFPGEFVEANRQGIVISTQIGPEEQYSVVLDPQRASPFYLNDLPWVMDINDHERPQILGYRGSLGDCLVYGKNCVPPPDECDKEDDHPANNQGQGDGHAWGQNPCHRPWLGIEHHARNHCSETDEGCEPAPGEGAGTDFDGPLPAGNKAVLVQWNGTDEPQQFAFPEKLGRGNGDATVSEVFPLALNNDTALLRGNISDSQQVHWQRLLVCRFDADEPDPQGNGQVECNNGLQPLEPLETGTRIRTVLGFSLNNAGTLIGNTGFRSSGIGTPFRLDIHDSAPEVEPLYNLVSGMEGRELHTVTDINEKGETTGYGYTDCGTRPDTFFLIPEDNEEAQGPRFLSGSFPDLHSRVAPGESVTLSPETEASGTQFRYRGRTPDAEQWETLRDWGTSPLDLAPEDEGPYCVQIQARQGTDSDSPVRDAVVRLDVSDKQVTPLPDEESTALEPADQQEAGPLGLSMPGTAGLLLWLVVALGGFFRRPLRESSATHGRPCA